MERRHPDTGELVLSGTNGRGAATATHEVVFFAFPFEAIANNGSARSTSADAQAGFRGLLSSKGPQSARCVAAVSLGRFRGDGRATAAALLSVLSDEKQPPLVRSCAAVGLGRRLETDSPSRLLLPTLRLSPGLVAGPFKEVLSMR